VRCADVRGVFTYFELFSLCWLKLSHIALKCVYESDNNKGEW